jgi:Uma2 family endonuclease
MACVVRFAAMQPEMTLDDWAAMSEDEPGELVDGRLVEEEEPDLLHEALVAWLILTLKNWIGGQGFVFGSGGKYAVGPRRGRRPDVTVYLPGSRKPEPRGVVRTPPDIAIEVISSPSDGQRCRVEKVEDYAAFGVRWYWLVDPAPRLFEVLELSRGARYVAGRYFAEGDHLAQEVPGCAGLALDLRALWAEGDRLQGP